MLIKQEDFKNYFDAESKVFIFPANSKFGNGCEFGDECKFGDWCKFDAWCEFGDWCKFGDECKFDAWCEFGDGCSAVSIVWGYMYTPTNLKIKKIIPPSTLKNHYTKRLARFNFVIADSDCYQQIQDKCDSLTSEQKQEILAWDGWLDIERMTIESWFSN